MTPEEFKVKARAKLRSKHYQELVWNDLVSVVGGSQPIIKDRILDAIKTEQRAEVGRIILYLIEQKVKIDVESELDSIVADGQLSLEEFSRIFD